MIQARFMVTALAFCAALCACERRHEPVWLDNAPTWDRSQLPLAVHDVDGSFGSTLGGAIGLFNGAAGCDVLRRDGTNGAPIAVVAGLPAVAVDDASHRCADYGACSYLGSSPGPTCYIFYVTPSTVDTDYKVLAHELGHCLGLADDVGYKNSVMRDRQPTQDGPFHPTLVTSADAAALRTRYCQD